MPSVYVEVEVEVEVVMVSRNSRSVALLVVLLGLVAPSFALASSCINPNNNQLLDPLGEVNGGLPTNVSDVICSILVVLWDLDGQTGPLPGCMGAPASAVDVNCDGNVNVEDAINIVHIALTGTTASGAACLGSCVELISGCTDPSAQNFDASANNDNGDCVYAGCTDPLASNFDAQATVDDGSCILGVPGCLNPGAANFDPNATASVPTGNLIGVGTGHSSATTTGYGPENAFDGDTSDQEVSTWLVGGTNAQANGLWLGYEFPFDIAINRVRLRQTYSNPCYFVDSIKIQKSDDGTTWEDVYTADVTVDGDTADFFNDIRFSNLETAAWWRVLANSDAPACGSPDIWIVQEIEMFAVGCVFFGCIDATANNYDPQATFDDGSCTYGGCTDPEADNFDPFALTNTGNCLYGGCIDPMALNFEPDKNLDNGTCGYSTAGCLDPAADNYNAAGTVWEHYADIATGGYGYTSARFTNSGSGSSNSPTTIFDKKSTTYLGLHYGNNTAGQNVYIEYDFGFDTAVVGFRLNQYYSATNANAVPAVLVQKSDDRSTWTDVVEFTDLTWEGNTADNFNERTFDFSTPARFWRLKATQNTFGSAYWWIADLEFLAGGCLYTGCTDHDATNYNASSRIDDGSCVVPVKGCQVPGAANIDASATQATPTNLATGGMGYTSARFTNSGSGSSNSPTTLFDGSDTTHLGLHYGNNTSGQNVYVEYDFKRPKAITGFMLKQNYQENPCSTVPSVMVQRSANRVDWTDVYLATGLSQPGNRPDGYNHRYFANTDRARFWRLQAVEDALCSNYWWVSEVQFLGGECDYDGCTDPDSFDYQPGATIDDGSCTAPTFGCMDPDGADYAASATKMDRGDLTVDGIGYTSTRFTNSGSGSSNSPTTIFDDSVTTHLGLHYGNATDTQAVYLEYDFLRPTAVTGFMLKQQYSESPCNAVPSAMVQYSHDRHNWVDVFHATGMSYAGNRDDDWNHYHFAFSDAARYWRLRATANAFCSSYWWISEMRWLGDQCSYPGCTDLDADNFDLQANSDDGSCIAPVYGCMDPSAGDYNPLANKMDIGDVNNGGVPYSSTIFTNSGSGSSHNASTIFDNNHNTHLGLHYAHNTSVQDVYAEYEFDRPKAVTGIRLRQSYSESSCSAVPTAVVQYSHDRANWVDAYTAMDLSYGGNQPDYYNEHHFPYSATARHWRVRATEDANCANYWWISELEFLGDDCEYQGCTDPLASNYAPLARVDDGSCNPVVAGCMDTGNSAYDPTATVTSGPDQTFGGTAFSSTIFTNFGSGSSHSATTVFDDKDTTVLGLHNAHQTDTHDVYVGYDLVTPRPITSVTLVQRHPTFGGCVSIPSVMVQYSHDNSTWVDAHHATGLAYGGNQPDYKNSIHFAYVATARYWRVKATANALCSNYWWISELEFIGGGCDYDGCTDPMAANYDFQATNDDGSCQYLGCTDVAAHNFDPSADLDDGGCVYTGCFDPNANNYDPMASVYDGSCTYAANCEDPAATNFSAGSGFLSQDLTKEGEGLASALYTNSGSPSTSPIYLFDGSTSTAIAIANAHQTATKDIYAEYDFKYPTAVLGARLNQYYGANNCYAVSDAVIQYSDDHHNWLDGPTWSGLTWEGTTGDNYNEISFAYVATARYWRLRATVNANCGNWWWIRDLELIGGGCRYEGCTDPDATNFDSAARFDGGSCTASSDGCMDPTGANHTGSHDRSPGDDITSGGFAWSSALYTNSGSPSTHADYIFDDGSSTYIAITNAHQTATKDIYATYEFARAESVTGFALDQRYGITACYAVSDAVVEYSDDNANWTLAYTATDLKWIGDNPDQYNHRYFGHVARAKFWRLRATQNANCGNWWWIRDLKFFGGGCTYEGCMDEDAWNYDQHANTDNGSCTAPVLGCLDPSAGNYDSSADRTTAGGMTTGGFAYSSTLYTNSGAPSTSADYLFDDSPTTYIAISNAHQTATKDIYAAYDLGAPRAVTGFALHQKYSTTGCWSVSAADIEYSHNNADWTLAYSATGLTWQGNNPDYYNYRNFPYSATARYWRIRATQNANCGNWWFINDIEFFGDGCDHLGCTNPVAENYDHQATVDDGSCDVQVQGCMDPAGANYDANAEHTAGVDLTTGGRAISSGISTYSGTGAGFDPAWVFDDTGAETFIRLNDGYRPDTRDVYFGYIFDRPQAVTAFRINQRYSNSGCDAAENVSIQYSHDGANWTTAATITGLTWAGTTADHYDEARFPFSAAARMWRVKLNEAVPCSNYWWVKDIQFLGGDCEYNGCTDRDASNFDELATVDDGSCDWPELGCMDSAAVNYDAAHERTSAGNLVGTGEGFSTSVSTYSGPASHHGQWVFDGSTETAIRLNNAYRTDTHVVAFEYQFEKPVAVTGLRLDQYYSPSYATTGGDIIPAVVVQYSQDRVNWVDAAELTGLTWLGNTPDHFNERHFPYSGVSRHWRIRATQNAPCSNYWWVREVEFLGGDCDYLGCTNPGALNYDIQANLDDGTCDLPFYGCLDPTATNHDPTADLTSGYDLTLYGEAFSSGIDSNVGGGSNSAEWAFDFSAETAVRLSNLNNAPSGAVFLDYDFGEPVAITAVRLNQKYPEDPCYAVGEAMVQYSDNRLDWVDAHLMQNMGWAGDAGHGFSIRNFAYQGTARYWRLKPTVDALCANHWWVRDLQFVGGGCEYDGCMDPAANNYAPQATSDDGSCTYAMLGCMDDAAANYVAAADTPTVDLTTGGNAYSSSIDSHTGSGASNNAQFAFDDAADTFIRLSNLVNNATTDIYLEYDLGRPEAITGVVLNQRYTTNPCFALRSGLVEYSDDRVSWTIAHEVTDFSWGGDGGTGVNTRVFPSVGAARYWRLKATGSVGCNNSNHWWVSDLQFLGSGCAYDGCTDPDALNFDELATDDDASCVDPTYGCMDSTATNFNASANRSDGGDLTTGGTASSSSIHTNSGAGSGNNAQFVFDDTLGTYVALSGTNTATTTDRYWAYDFGTPVAITGLRLNQEFGGSGCSTMPSVTIQHSSDGSTWTDAETLTGLGYGGNRADSYNEFHFDYSATAQHWRVKAATNTTCLTYWWVQDIELLGGNCTY